MPIKDKNILITGGTGTIGRELVKKAISSGAHQVCVFSRDEQKQNLMRSEIKNEDVKFIIGDVRDYNSLCTAMEGMDIVFHTAAMKIVSICQSNPLEAFYTNILGTQNVIRSARFNKVGEVIFTSSDKAANPTSTMGISKLYSERLIAHANTLPNTNTIFSSVRFGNVLGSRGSVVDLFIKEIKSKGYVTITDREMSRFVLSKKQAVDIIINNIDVFRGGEILISKMPALRIIDLAKTLINLLAPKYNKHSCDIKVKITGKNPEEKLYEEIITEHEAERTFELNNCYCILPMLLSKNRDYSLFQKGKKINTNITSTTDNNFMTENQILDFLCQEKIICGDD